MPRRESPRPLPAKGRGEGELKAEVVDTKDLKFEYLLAVRRGLSTKATE